MKLPKGGTELQVEFLHKHVSKEILDQVQIVCSIPERIPLHPTKPNILWLHNNYDQLKTPDWFRDKNNHSKYDYYVYNSHWCYEKYRMAFNMPTHNALIIKNGIPEIKVSELNYIKGDPIKLIYHSTPWRGLNILLGAMQKIKNPLITLDVYSSTVIYGSQFEDSMKGIYDDLFEQAKQLPNVNYIGYKPNEYLIENMHKYHIFAYPSIWEETFCGCAVEAMAAGLYCITTDYGALFETCAEFPVYIPITNDANTLVERFAFAIEAVAGRLHESTTKKHLQFQSEYMNNYYNWPKQSHAWSNFLKGAINAKRRPK